MATREEVVAAIREGQERVAATFGRLTEEQLATRIHDDEGDRWTAKQVLAHLAGRAAGYARLTQMGIARQTPPAAGGRFDVDEWNRQRVEERIDRPASELLEEFRRVHDDLIAQVEAMPDQSLSRVVPLPAGERPLSDVLLMSGGRHSVSHAEVVERALGLPAPGR